MAETHISAVFFLGDRAYKVKKPVDLGFVDQTSRAARQELCHREVALNRRLAPDVYLGVADVVAPSGATCDHMVVMRRMPPERRLAALVAGGADVDGHVRALARLVADFHERCATSPDISAAGTADAVSENWEAGFRQLQRAVPHLIERQVLERCRSLSRRYVIGRRPLFEARVREERIRDGHGDLLADDIFFLDDGPRVLDCIEFDDRLRYGDVLADVAFLAMDLERLGEPELGSRFLAWYREFSGESWPDSLAHHYIAYRAQVRSKVACLRAAQGDEGAAAAAPALLQLCQSHLERARVRLVLVGGGPGTGKSTIARAVADRIGAVLLRTDEIRRELPPCGERHSDAARDVVYREMLRRAQQALSLGESVVLDATWARASWRRDAHGIAADTVSDLTELQCVAPAEVAAARVATRSATRVDPSDATPDVARAIAAHFDPWPSATVIATDGPETASVDAAFAGLFLEGARA